MQRRGRAQIRGSPKDREKAGLYKNREDVARGESVRAIKSEEREEGKEEKRGERREKREREKSGEICGLACSLGISILSGETISVCTLLSASTYLCPRSFGRCRQYYLSCFPRLHFIIGF